MKARSPARVLFAWELGDNHGHLLRHVQLARSLRRQGYPILFAVRNTTIARSALMQDNFHFVQAPIYQTRSKSLPETNSYADVLLGSGYASSDELDGLLRSWTTTLSLYKPDLLIADHAPTALLAARLMNIHAILVGTGFEIPPTVDPLPSLISWRPVDAADLLRSSSLALLAVNKCLEYRNAPPLGAVSDLFKAKRALVTSIPEIDPYGPRNSVDYIGTIDSRSVGQRESWSPSSQRRVFIYLHNDASQLTSIVKALLIADCEAICVLPNLADQELPLSHGKFRFYNKLVDVEDLLPNASLVISNAGNGLAGMCIGLGVPMLLLPVFLEQYITAYKVAKLGLGSVTPHNLPPEQLAALIIRAFSLPKHPIRRPAINAQREYERAISEALSTI